MKKSMKRISFQLNRVHMFKGSMTRDFQFKVEFMKQFPPGP
jgi:hypothetical protein